MNLKKNAGYKAAEYVNDGDILGLGTGSTTHYFIEKVGKRIKEEEIEVMGIPTSYQSSMLANRWNIPLTNLEEHSIDLAVDGADEVDENLNLIKGGGAAHTMEKIVDYSAEKFYVVIDPSKYVEQLGGSPVPIEIIPQASKPAIQEIEEIGGNCQIRMAEHKDGPVITDNGNFIIDAQFKKIESPTHMEIDLNTIPGVVENGIFTEMVDKLIIGTQNGTQEI